MINGGSMKKLIILALISGVLVACKSGEDATSSKLSTINYLINGDLDYSIADGKPPVRAGKESKKIEIRMGDCNELPLIMPCDVDTDRNQILLTPNLNNKDTTWIGFSVFVPKQFRSYPKLPVIIAEIDQFYLEKNMKFGQIIESRPPLFRFNIVDERFFIDYHQLSGNSLGFGDKTNEFPISNLDKLRDRWTDFMIEINTGTKPYLKLYANGNLKFESNKNLTQFRPAKDYHFRYGLARNIKFAKLTKDPYISDGNLRNRYRQLIYFDEVRMGSSRSEVEIAGDKLTPLD